jgi:hypothetical protein
MASTPPPDISVSKNDNLSVQGKNISTKTAYFKFGTSVNTTDTVMEIITKDSDKIEVQDKIPVSDTEGYYVTNIDKTPVKFATGTPLVTQTTNIRFPRPEAKQYTPEKVATFLIFKK